MTPVPTVREGDLATGVGWAIAAWTWWYTVDLGWRADNVTSNQWRYLMSIPGHQWTWVTLFGAAAFTLSVGMLTTRYRMRAAGFALAGLGAALIAGFYVLAPLINPGLTTLGYHPWVGWCAALLFCAVVNWRPVQWF